MSQFKDTAQREEKVCKESTYRQVYCIQTYVVTIYRPSKRDTA